MSKKLLFRLFALVAALACALGASAYDFTYGGYYYNILTDSTVAITYKSGYNSYSGNVTIPEHVYNGNNYYTVTQVGYYAFMNSTGLTSVTIPNTVTEIKSRSFEGCTSLQSVVMGKNCSFYDPQVGGDAAEVFKNCPNITSVTCWMFEPDSWYEGGYLNFDQSVLNNATLFVPRGAIPNYQATEGWRLFANIQEISATYNYDFYKDGIFYKIRSGNLVKVTYRDEDYNTYSGTVTVPSRVTYDNTTYYVKGIGDNAFSSCGDLISVNMPTTIDSIGKYAFYYCAKLTEIDIPNGVTYIGNGAFSWCSNLKSLMFPAGLTVINGSTCTGCSALETIWLPVDLTDIYAGAFYYCNAITRIISLSEAPPWMYNKNVFPSTVYDNATLYIPEDAIGNGYTSPYGNWQYFTTQLPYSQYLSDAVNATGGNITFSTLSTDNYPWLVKTNGNRICAQSGNTSIPSSSSVLTASVTVPNGGTLSFLYKAWGEGTPYFDRCSFYVDDVQKFSYGALNNDWETYSMDLAPGDHTLKWCYDKDGSVNPVGDYFAIDNVLLTPYVPEAYACYTSSNTTLTFYYDTQRSSRPGVTYDLNTGNNDTGWETDGSNANVTKVVFDPSFADARPTTTYSWFYDMSNLQSISGMSYLNTSEVTNMGWMFGHCSKLTSLDVSHFNTSKVTDMSGLFYECSCLTSLDVSSFNTSKVTTMENMFLNCRGLTSLNVSNFNTSKVTNMNYMFDECIGLTSLDLSSFNTSQVTIMNWMFGSCKYLRTIYVGNGWNTTAVEYSNNMFYYCSRLVGGQGTTYDSSNPMDKTYAHIDGGPSNPGYFTAKSTIMLGDVNGDGNVTISDVTALIDLLLGGSNINNPAADCNGDTNVTISDVTALIDYLLSGSWN